MQDHDVLIIGAGPAGLTCGMYCARADLDVVLLEMLAPGGQMALTELIENYPGFEEGVMGAELASKMADQAKRFGLKIENGNVIDFQLDGEYKIVKTDTETYRCKVLVIASGTNHRELGIPGEESFSGRGVSFCATCDGPFYRDKEVTVVGGGDSAIQESLFLAKFASKITIIHRRDELRAVKSLVDKARNTPKIHYVWNSHVTEVLGETGVDAIRVRNKLTGEESTIPCTGFFIFIGMVPNVSFLNDLCKVDKLGFILTDDNCETDIPGVFAVGDVRAKTLRQVSTAVGDGATAAHNLEKYLE